MGLSRRRFFRRFVRLFITTGGLLPSVGLPSGRLFYFAAPKGAAKGIAGNVFSRRRVRRRRRKPPKRKQQQLVAVELKKKADDQNEQQYS